jgi:hypothetical protein
MTLTHQELRARDAALVRELETAIRPELHINSGNTVRQRWDALWLAVDAKHFNMNKLYDAGWNDARIDTALRRIFHV